MMAGGNDPCGSGKGFKCNEAEVASRPRSPSPAEFNQLGSLFNTGHYAELESRARSLLEQYPDSGFAWQLLGGSLQMQGKDSLHPFRRAAELMPEDAGAHFNLGVILKSLGQLNDAVASYRRALELRPNYAEALFNLGNALRELGQIDSAAESYRRVLAFQPGSAEAHFNVGTALRNLGKFDDALGSYRRALELKPDLLEAHISLGATLHDQNRLDEAQASYRRALELKPDLAQIHYNLGEVLHDQNRLDEAQASYRRALELKPDYPDAHYHLGTIMQNLWRFDGAVASYRQVLKIKPDDADAHNNLLFCLSHSETMDAATLFSEHCRFGEQFEPPLRANWPQHGNSRNPERCLQIGFVSADLQNHAVASFIEPVLAHLAGYPQLSLHAYYNRAAEDRVTQRLRGYLAHWHPIAGLTDDALAQQIRADGIDILIDLSGHTGMNRLLTFARKPAPVQVSWMGYPGTTGLSAMDYYFADRFFLPPGKFDNQFTEKIVQLPANVPFMPSKSAPAVNELPALNNGYITFGSFNRPSKISRSVIALWAQLLRNLPDSRILLGCMPEDGQHGTLIEWFAQEGIEQERLNFHVRCSMERYLALHHQVDICLDTFPYNGGTTTFHALWMGVPTLTLAGVTAAGRQGAAILGHVGLEAFVANDAAHFVHQGLSWAGDFAALSDIRAGLRGRFARSAIGQPAVIAVAVERALRTMWQRWCSGLPPVSFEVS